LNQFLKSISVAAGQGSSPLTLPRGQPQPRNTKYWCRGWSRGACAKPHKAALNRATQQWDRLNPQRVEAHEAPRYSLSASCASTLCGEKQWSNVARFNLAHALLCQAKLESFSALTGKAHLIFRTYAETLPPRHRATGNKPARWGNSCPCSVALWLGAAVAMSLAVAYVLLVLHPVDGAGAEIRSGWVGPVNQTRD
jgi:hypothetical protein